MTTTEFDPVLIKLLEAIEPHVVFDGWTSIAFESAVADAGIDPALAKSTCPRGALDLAVAYHRVGDARMVEKMASADLSQMRYSEKVAHAIWLRLEDADREIVRRGTTLFALPHHAAEGSALIWGTADAIWTALGDTSEDVNWYSKRMTLSAVYGAVVLYWLGDETFGEATKEFIDRRIADVMKFEKVKASVRKNPAFRPLVAGIDRLLGGIKAPRADVREDLPGRWVK